MSNVFFKRNSEMKAIYFRRNAIFSEIPSVTLQKILSATIVKDIARGTTWTEHF